MTIRKNVPDTDKAADAYAEIKELLDAETDLKITGQVSNHFETKEPTQ